MKKSYYLIFFSFLFFFFSVSVFKYSSYLKSLYDFPMMFYFPVDLSVCLDYEFTFFMFMLMLVSSLVVLYSEMYMEQYNNKKFFFLTMAFLFSMIILSSSGSMIMLMMGWDFLGLSSLFLIMFYPGKTPMYNSFMTFFYNRLGDCVMIMALCLMVNNSSAIVSIIQEENLIFMVFLIMICSFTKSAQFPLSSWLPAAMSAPTPISAMVHSSTLVTAGVFLICKFIFFFQESGFMIFLVSFSSITFLMGGVMAVLEADLKKIVAFSTMSQISMIIFFSCSSFFFLPMAHMIFHAFFKTLLFCSCGISFIWIFSDQLSKFLSLETYSYCFIYFFFLSIFCMTGLPFSSSFYTKDVFIEICSSFMNSFFFFILMMGSFMTILYSGKIFSFISKSFFSYSFSFNKKKVLFIFIFLFSLFSILSPYFVQFFLLSSYFPTVSKQDVLIVILIMVSSMLINSKIPSFFSVMNMEMIFSKFFSFSLFSKLSKLDNMSFHFNDHMMFKPSVLLDYSNNFFSSFKSLLLFFNVIFFYFLCFK